MRNMKKRTIKRRSPDFLPSHISVVGSSHSKSGICQDNSTSFGCSRYGIAIVCDGHGSEKHFRSDKGAKLAAEVGILAIIHFMEEPYVRSMGVGTLTEYKRGDQIKQLEKNIISKWHTKVEMDMKDNPFSEDELSPLNAKDKDSINIRPESAYGTTFLAIIMTKTYCFGIQLGDGDCLVKNTEGNIIYPMDTDERLQFNITTSLCDADAINNFREFYKDESFASAMVSTDGVRNSFMTEQHFSDFAIMIFDSYSEQGTVDAEKELKEYLPKLSKAGSGDDMSISLILDNYTK